MLIVTSTITTPFIVILCIIFVIIVVIFCHNAFAKQKYKQKVDIIARKSKKLTDELDLLFEPNKKTTQEEIDSLLAENEETIKKIKELCKTKSRFKSLLKSTGIYGFIEEIEPARLRSRLNENNTVYDAIKQLSALCDERMKEYTALVAPSHYFAYSEFERFKKSLVDIEKYEKIVYPKYAKCVDGKTIELLRNTRDKLDNTRTEHNRAFVSAELDANKSYFDTVLGKYPLDPQQRDSIVKLDDNCLVIASAGSGKTSTILGKAKYLVEKRNIDPSKVLLITYTRKAANELQERMKIAGMTCSTFHALAYQIIAQVTGQAPSICNPDVPLNVFRKLILNNNSFLHAVNNYFINQQSLMKLEHDYQDAFTYFEDRKKYGIQALFPDNDGRMVFTKSEEEKRIISILTKLGVSFRYECPYQYNTVTPERRQYKPDFTIYFKDKQGQLKWVYLEHFAIDENGKVPIWFGDGVRGGWRMANEKYNEGKVWKRQTHRQYGTILIETTSADFKNGSVEEKLKKQLIACGVPVKERSDQELYELLVKRNRKLEKSVYTLIVSFITLMKANEKSINGLLNELNYFTAARSKDILTEIIKPFFEEYDRTLKDTYEIDFTDAIIQATNLCRQGLWKQYDYILVDEFQDISVDRYKFLQALRSDEPKTKLYCVGDDWQSIFRFAGSDMSLFYDFENYFGHTEICKIETTYRFHQPLIDMSSEFIIKNKEQKEKTIRPPKDDKYSTYLTFYKCDGENNGVLKKVEEIVAKTHASQSIMLLGRYNYDAASVGYQGKVGMNDNKIRVKVGNRELPFLSVHSAKGLEADVVILVNCNQGAYGFPSLIEDDPILDFVLSKKESYPFAEERRLFYVAMTRARMHMYVLYDQDKPSPFISEFMLKVDRGSCLCPRCLEGKVVPVKEGIASNGSQYRCYKCNNKDGGCDFFETKYGDLTPPGIKITDEMTAQDIEKMRERRRYGKLWGLSK